MSTAKHYSFCSGPMRGQPVTALPGIGAAYGDRLERAGYSSASDIYEKFKSFGFESGRCQNWLSMTCGANSRYSSMCYEAIKEWHTQFGKTQTSSRRSQSPKSELSYLSPLTLLSRDDFYGNKQMVHQQSPARSKDTDITRAEVLEMMAQFQKKQDAMSSRIHELEQEKARNAAKVSCLEKEQTKTNNYVKTLEARIKQMDRMANVLQKQQNTNVEQYKNMSNTIYLINQKLDETWTKIEDMNLNSVITDFVTVLETRIERIDENMKKQLKEHDKKILELTRKLNDEYLHIVEQAQDEHIHRYIVK